MEAPPIGDKGLTPLTKEQKEAINAELEADRPQRDSRGLFVKGNKQASLSKGVTRIANRREFSEAQLEKRATEIADERLKSALPGIVDALNGKAAKGDLRAIEIHLRSSMRKKPETFAPSGIMAELADFDPASRIHEINRYMLAGVISSELGADLIRSTKDELEVGVLHKLKRLTKQIPSLTSDQVIHKLVEIGQDFDPVEIDHEQ